MNLNQQFDNSIKKQFEDYLPDVHPHIWENIINKKEKRKPFGLWLSFFNKRNILFLVTALLLVSGGIYFGVGSSVLKSKNIITVNQQQLQKNEPLTKISKNKILNNVFNTAYSSIALIKNNTTNFKLPILSSTPTIKPNLNFVKINDADNKVFDFNNKYYSATKITTQNVDSSSNVATKIEPVFKLNNIFFISAEKIKSIAQSGTLLSNSFHKIFLPDCPTAEKDAAGNKTYIEFYTGPDYAFKNLSDTGNSVYLQRRKQSTTFSSAFSAGVRYTKVFNNGMSVRSGINYSQINEKFSFVQGNLVQVTYIIDANGDTTGSYITTGTRYKTTINRYRTIDVPLLIGYEMGNGKLHTNINAGVMLNAYSWQNGDILDSSFQPISITTGKSNSMYQFKTNIGAGFMGSISFYYKLNNKIHVMAQPYFRYNLTPMNTETLTLKQKYNTVGLHLGVRLDLH